MTDAVTVVAIDDEQDILDFLATLLGTRGMLTFTALDGPGGIALVREKRPHVVLLDIMMPGMDGHQVCRTLKADPQTRGIPVVMLTAMNRVKDIARAVDEGADGFVAKPFDNESLVSLVTQVAAGQSGQPAFYLSSLPHAPSRLREDLEAGRLVTVFSLREVSPRVEELGRLPGVNLMSLEREPAGEGCTHAVALVEVGSPEALGRAVNVLVEGGCRVDGCRVFRDALEVPFHVLPRSEHNE